MKKKSLLAVALTAIMFASCSNEEVAVIDNTGDSSLEVTLPGAVGTRVVEAPNPDGKQAIVPIYTNVFVFLKDAGGNAVAYKWSDAEITERKKIIQNIVKPASVLVVANSGTVSFTEGSLLKVDLDAKLAALAIADQNKGADGVKKVTLMDEKPPVDDGANKLKAVLTLNSLVSRFEIGTVKKGDGLDELTLEAVYINYFYNNYGKSSSQELIETKWPETFTPAWATDGGSTDVTTSAGSKCYAYQVFAGNLVPHIVFKVGGTVTKDYQLSDGTTGEFTGKYVTIKGFKNATGTDITEILANKIYKVGLGAGTDAGGIKVDVDEITDKPEKPEYELTVNITVADWTTENLTPNL